MSPAVGPYSPVRRVGDWVITSGQVGLATKEDGTTGIVPGGTLPELHQALGMVWSEGIALDTAGEPVDLTIRSFGILAARDMPEVTVRLHHEDGWPVNGSDAVFAATLAAAWIAEGLPARWPTRRDAARAPARDVAPSPG